jgi:hypothetical protein
MAMIAITTNNSINVKPRLRNVLADMTTSEGKEETAEKRRCIRELDMHADLQGQPTAGRRINQEALMDR